MKPINEAINDELKWALERYLGVDEIKTLNNDNRRNHKSSQ